MNFITDNYEIILLAIAGIGGLFLLGKQKSLAMAKTIIHEVRDEVGNDIIANQDKYTDFVYNKLPLKAKVFVTKAMVNKLIVEVGHFIDSDLDN
jgi:hypothetical protein